MFNVEYNMLVHKSAPIQSKFGLQMEPAWTSIYGPILQQYSIENHGYGAHKQSTFLLCMLSVTIHRKGLHYALYTYIL